MSNYKLSSKYPQKRAFITGAGSGFGRALCIELAKDNWNIAISDINEEGLNETAELITKVGGKPTCFTLDVADRVAYKNVVNEIMADLGGIDLLINNAGVGDGGFVGDYTLENWDWILGINQMGVLYGCHFFVPIMKQQGSGLIINVASIAAISNAPRMACYNMPKAAVKSLSETLYGELMPSGVDVKVVMPYFFRTNINEQARGDEEAKEVARYLVKGASHSAEQIAQKILRKAGTKKFYLIEPWQGKLLFHFQRLMPQTFLNFNSKMIRNEDRLKSHAKKRYEKFMKQQDS